MSSPPSTKSEITEMESGTESSTMEISESGSKAVQTVSVYARFRPYYGAAEEKEKLGGKAPVVELDDETQSVEVMLEERKNFSKFQVKKGTMDNQQELRFTFDNVFHMDSSQEEVFFISTVPLVQETLDGYNATIFAYGQTGSGKTHTMMGIPESDEERGIIPRMAEELFKGAQRAPAGISYTIECQYVEIYMEKIRDLLNDDNDNLKIVADKNGEMSIPKATREKVSKEEDILRIMTIGNKNRNVGSTMMNARSSRSHAVFTIFLNKKDKNQRTETTSKLILVDLAGSEKVGKTGATGKALEEAKLINKSLTSLGMVIKALTEGDKHVPYRDSTLTRLLTDSLGGNSKTALIICCSPSWFNREETLSTLRFGSRAKHIKNKPKMNVKKSVDEYMHQICAAVTLLLWLDKRAKKVRLNHHLHAVMGKGLWVCRAIREPLRQLKQLRAAYVIQAAFSTYLTLMENSQTVEAVRCLQQLVRTKLRRENLEKELKDRVAATTDKRVSSSRLMQRSIRHSWRRQELRDELGHRVEETRRRKEEQRKMEEEKRRAEEEERRRKLEEERQRAEEEERVRHQKEEEERKRREELARKLAEEERKRQEEEKKRRHAHMQAEIKRMEEERRKLEEERKKAEEERRVREEEEKKRREEELKRKEEEALRMEEEMRRLMEEARRAEEEAERQRQERVEQLRHEREMARKAKEEEEKRAMEAAEADLRLEGKISLPQHILAAVPDAQSLMQAHLLERKAQEESRRLRNILLKGDKFLKYGKRGRPHMRYLCFNVLGNLHWDKHPMDPYSLNPSPNFIKLSDMQKILRGKESEVLKKKAAKNAPPQLLFTIVAKDRTLDLQCLNQAVRDDWIHAIVLAVRDMREGLDFMYCVDKEDKLEHMVSHTRSAKGPSLERSLSYSVATARCHLEHKTVSRDDSFRCSVSELNSISEDPSSNGASTESAGIPTSPETFTGQVIMFGWGTPQIFYLSLDGNRLYWQKELTRSPEDMHCELSEVTSVQRGKVTCIHKRRSTDVLSPPQMCFSVILADDRTLDFQVESEESRDAWAWRISRHVQRLRAEKQIQSEKVVAPSPKTSRPMKTLKKAMSFFIRTDPKSRKSISKGSFEA